MANRRLIPTEEQLVQAADPADFNDTRSAWSQGMCPAAQGLQWS